METVVLQAEQTRDGRFFCPHCREDRIITVTGRAIIEEGQTVLLVKTRASKVLQKGEAGRKPELVVRGRCPRCRETVEMPAILVGGD